MWRSIAARACRSRMRSGRQTFHLQSHLSQVHLPSHYSTPISPKKSPFSLNPRFFSQDSTEPSIEDAFEFSNPQISETMEDFDAISDKIDVSAENPLSTSSESDSEASSPAPVEEDSVENEVVEEEPIREVNVEQLQSVLSLLQSATENGSLKSSLDEMNLNLHDEFVIRVIETPLVPGEKLIAFFKWALENPEFHVSSLSLEALVLPIRSGLKKKDAYALWDLIKEIGEKKSCGLNTGILNELISLLSKLGEGQAVLEVFDKLDELGCVPDGETYYYTMEALFRCKFFDLASSVSEKMVSAGKLPDSQKVGQVISYLCNGKKTKEAHSVYLLAKEGDKYPPQSSVNFLIGSLCRVNDAVPLASEMLEDIPGEKRKYAIKPFMSVINGLCRIKDVEGAKNLLLKMINAGPSPSNAVFNSVINGLSKAGDMDEARKMIKLMESRGLKPDVLTYTVVMSGYTKGGEMKEAREVLSEAKSKHSKLSPQTYHTLISGYCKLGEFEEAVKLLGEMKEFGVSPNADEYSKLIQSLCLYALDWETAQKLINEMEENGLHLNGITKSLVKAVEEIELEVENEKVAVAVAA